MSTEIWKALDHDETGSHIGAGIHTALRKAGEAPGSYDLWKAIDKHDEAWRDAVEFCLYGLEYMGMALCEKADPLDEDEALSIARQVYARESPLKSEPAVARMLDEVALAVLARAGTTPKDEGAPSEDAAVEIVAATPLGARPMHSTTVGDETARDIVRRLSEAGLLARAGDTKGTETEVESPPVLSKVTEDLPEGSYVVDARDIMWKRGEEKWWSGSDNPSSPKDFDRMLLVYGPLRLISVGGQS